MIAGQVQGVGFRPFVHQLAAEHRLSGFVRNTTAGVTIECQGPADELERFHADLLTRQPPLARIRQVIARSVATQPDASDQFQILSSTTSDECRLAEVTADTATCPACAAEILDRSNRRHGYALITCTHCGPRYSITRSIPYDRANTTMAAFDLCDACAREYTDPAHRRFHAEPIACAACGPTVSLVGSYGQAIGGDPIRTTVQLLRDGQTVAIKGLGGFHLAVRADDQTAVQRLRALKKRDAKPFALMCRSLSAARQIVELSSRAAALLRSSVCPIVLARRQSATTIASAVAPGSHRLGVMLPYTPLHHLLFHEAPDLAWLVMTSGNVSDEPLVIDNDECVHRLGPLCDAILWHNRPIARGVDDSIVIDMVENADPIPLRRARGLVPTPIMLPCAAPTPGLCVGADLKGAVAVVRGDRAIVGQHLGDLAHPQALANFRDSSADLCALFNVVPQWIAHDLHPAYFSTVEARRMAQVRGVPLIPVQHHHAHAASLMAEHGIEGPILAVVCDGTGYGADGTIWGGELLRADLRSFDRVATLRPLRLPGGDAAARDGRRSALALLFNAFGPAFAGLPITARLVSDARERDLLVRMISGSIRCATSSGAGRLFDAIAALLGVCEQSRYEAQAALMLEARAAQWASQTDDEALEFATGERDLFEIDPSPFVRRLVHDLQLGRPIEELAWRFHAQFAEAWARVVSDAADRTGLRTVGLTGGVFCNEILTRLLTDMLTQRGLRVLRHRVVPPNDGGIALGQAAVAVARLSDGGMERS